MKEKCNKLLDYEIKDIQCELDSLLDKVDYNDPELYGIISSRVYYLRKMITTLEKVKERLMKLD